MLQLLFVDIEKYPVTNEEYWEFCEATNRDKGRTAQGRPRQPVVYVSWFDAMDYACWRATRDGSPWRLPTEDELSAAERLVPEDSDFSQWPLPELPDVDAHPEIVNDLGHECLLGVIYQWTMRPEDKAKYDTLWVKYVKRRNKRETNAAITAAGLTFDAPNQVNSGGAFYEAAYLAKESSPCDMTPEYAALDLGFRVVVDAEESNRVFLGSCFLESDPGHAQRSGNRTSLRDDFLGFRLAMDIDNGDDQVVLSGCWAYSEEDAAKGDSSSLEPVFRLNDTGFRLASDTEADRVFRGGSWYSTAVSARAAIRLGDFPGSRGRNLGFRLVLDTDDWSRAASGGSYYYPSGIASASDGGNFHPGFLRENIGFRLASDTDAAQPRRGGSWFDDTEYAPIIIAGEGDPTNQMRLLGFRLAVDTGDSLRVDRGGYWLEEAFDAGIGKRFEDDPAYAGIVIGFRLAVDTDVDRAFRGSGWNHFSRVRVANRLEINPTYFNQPLGFRLAADREPERSYRGGRWFTGPDRSKFVTHTGCDTDYSGVGVGFRLAVDTEADRVFRGGCWGYSAQDARVARRNRFDPTYRDFRLLGFRLAVDTEADRVGRGGGWYDSARFARTALSLRDDPTICDSRLGFRLAVDTNNNEQE